VAFWSKREKTPQELMAAGQYDEAYKAFKSLIKKKRDDPIILLQMANLLQKMKKPAEAKRLFIKVGSFYGDRGFFNKAVAAFKKAYTITPDDDSILEKLAFYNDKVPKFMIDEHFLARIKGNVPAEDNEPLPVGDRFINPPLDDSAILDVTIAEVADASLNFSANFGVHDFEDIPDEVSSEFTTDSQSEEEEEKAPTAAPAKEEIDFSLVDVQMSGPGLDLEEADDTDESEEDVAAEPDRPAQAGPVPQRPPSAANPSPSHSQTTARSSGKMVFKAAQPTKPVARQSGVYNTFDDALDSLFSAPALEDSISMESSSQEENQNHWPLFRTMTPRAFMDFIVALETRDFEAGETIMREGDAGHEMFLVADGEVEITTAINDRQTLLAKLKEGEFFGEASVISGRPRNATVRAVEYTSCLILSKVDLANLAKTHPMIMASIESIYYTRKQHNASLRQ